MVPETRQEQQGGLFVFLKFCENPRQTRNICGDLALIYTRARAETWKVLRQRLMEAQVRETIEGLIAKNRVMLFMKGNKLFPSCGFSAQVVGILKQHGVPFETFNVLSDPAIRQGIKDFSQWPTIPQLYIDGEFIGGCDIVRELEENGDLATKLKDS